MTDRPIFDPNNPALWPTGDDGQPLTVEEVVDALAELVKRGLVEVMFDERNQMWVRATPDGHAAYAIETAFMSDEYDNVEWPE